MRSKLAGSIGVVAVAVVAFAAVQRRDAAEMSDVLVRVHGPLLLAADDSAGTVVVVGHNADVEGTVTEQLVVVRGTARVTGTVRGNLVVVHGHAELGPDATVGENVVLHQSTLERAPGARVGGVVHRRAAIEWSPVIGWIIWLSLTLVVLVAALVFAAVAGRQLFEAASRIATRPGPVVLTALIVAVGLPVLALLSLVSVIGIPLAMLIFFFIIPALALLGVAVTGTWIGAAVLRRWASAERYERSREHPYLAATIGVIALHIVGLIPFVGALIILLASQLGAGALIYRSWQGLRGRSRA